MWFLALCIFASLFWRARETLVKQPPGNCQMSDVSHLLAGCQYTWFGRLSNIVHRYRIFSSIIETYFINNIDFLAP